MIDRLICVFIYLSMAFPVVTVYILPGVCTLFDGLVHSMLLSTLQVLLFLKKNVSMNPFTPKIKKYILLNHLKTNA